MRDGNLKPWLKISFLLFFCALNGMVFGQAPLDHVPGEIIVKLKGDLSSNTNTSVFLTGGAEAQNIKELLPQLKGYDVSSVQKIFPGGGVRSMAEGTAASSLSNIYRISLPEDTDTAPILKALESDPEIEYASLNHLVKFCLVPNDPYLNTTSSWGNPHSDAWGFYRIQADKAWDITTGSKEVVIAVIDTGVDYEHEELKGKIIKGYDFSDRDDDPMDEDGHGTHIAGILAAQGNNSRGIAGMAWNCRILAIKIYPYGTEADCAQAIKYAADHVSGVRVINMSWHLVGASSSPLLDDAIRCASDKKIVMVAAAGNDKSDVVNYVPANHPEVIAVSSTDVDDKICPFSNRGNKIDVAAPGGGWGTLGGTYNVLSLKSRKAPDEYGSFVVGGEYLRLGGTSMAAAYVSGLAALILSKNPSLTKYEVESKIKSSTDDRGNLGFDEEYGYGRINALAALEKVPFPPEGVGGEPPDGSVEIEKVEPPDWVKALRVGDMALDDKGNMYVVYTNQHRVIKYKLAPSGRIEDSTALCSTGNFLDEDDRLHYPMAVAVSPSGGRVYVADTFKKRVLIFDNGLRPVGELKRGVVDYRQKARVCYEQWFGLRKEWSEKEGPIYTEKTKDLKFILPLDVEIFDQNEFLVLDSGRKGAFKFRIKKNGEIEPEVFDKVIETDSGDNIGNMDKILGGGGLILTPFDPVTGLIFIIIGGVSGSSKVEWYKTFSNYLEVPGASSLESICICSSGNIYIADTGNDRIQKFAPDGSFLSKFGEGILKSPKGIDIDAYGNIYVADTGNKRIAKFDAAGNFIDEYKPFNLRFAGGE